jgi:hypothetical protein
MGTGEKEDLAPIVGGWKDCPRLKGLSARIRLARCHQLEPRQDKMFRFKLLFCIIILGGQGTQAKEAVIFKHIGQLAGVFSYLHIHVEFSISSVEAQLQKYHQLLRQNGWTEIAVLNYMMAYVNVSHYIWKEAYGDKPDDLPEFFMVCQNANLWYKVAQLHLRYLDDMENDVTTLRKSLSEVPNRSTGWMPFKAHFTPVPGANLFQMDAYTDTHDHFLTLTTRWYPLEPPLERECHCQHGSLHL